MHQAIGERGNTHTENIYYSISNINTSHLLQKQYLFFFANFSKVYHIYESTNLPYVIRPCRSYNYTVLHLHGVGYPRPIARNSNAVAVQKRSSTRWWFGLRVDRYPGTKVVRNSWLCENLSVTTAGIRQDSTCNSTWTSRQPQTVESPSNDNRSDHSLIPGPCRSYDFICLDRRISHTFVW